jgi:hypothetical protein
MGIDRGGGDHVLQRSGSGPRRRVQNRVRGERFGAGKRQRDRKAVHVHANAGQRGAFAQNKAMVRGAGAERGPP